MVIRLKSLLPVWGRTGPSDQFKPFHSTAALVSLGVDGQAVPMATPPAGVPKPSAHFIPLIKSFEVDQFVPFHSSVATDGVPPGTAPAARAAF